MLLQSNVFFFLSRQPPPKTTKSYNVKADQISLEFNVDVNGVFLCFQLWFTRVPFTSFSLCRCM